MPFQDDLRSCALYVHLYSVHLARVLGPLRSRNCGDKRYLHCTSTGVYQGIPGYRGPVLGHQH